MNLISDTELRKGLHESIILNLFAQESETKPKTMGGENPKSGTGTIVTYQLNSFKKLIKQHILKL